MFVIEHLSRRHLNGHFIFLLLYLYNIHLSLQFVLNILYVLFET